MSKPTWNPINLETPALGKLNDDYRAKNKLATEACKKLSEAIRTKLEALHRTEIDEDGCEVAISFRFGQVSYAVLTPEQQTESKKIGPKKTAVNV